MRRHELKAALLLSLCMAGSVVATEPERASGPAGWFSFWNWTGKSEEKQPNKKVDKKPAKPEISAEERTARERVRQEADYFRRLEACNQLMKIAAAANDQDTYQRAQKLDERVSELYQRRLEQLPKSDVRVGSDDRILEEHLGPKSKSTKPWLVKERPSRKSGEEE